MSMDDAKETSGDCEPVFRAWRHWRTKREAMRDLSLELTDSMLGRCIARMDVARAIDEQELVDAVLEDDDA